ncbi:hypothetical protein NDU88_000869 [Pleurodeles waltl]|uniref:Uncharacterized protein n=1 Tax=Pleurodeles waltl TaxID=8319 RepID=A0AAV7SXU7_PLEWA|nr:hypothetical protein NDU88_000869 [Pleurodeles waltl]
MRSPGGRGEVKAQSYVVGLVTAWNQSPSVERAPSSPAVTGLALGSPRHKRHQRDRQHLQSGCPGRPPPLLVATGSRLQSSAKEEVGSPLRGPPAGRAPKTRGQRRQDLNNGQVLVPLLLPAGIGLAPPLWAKPVIGLVSGARKTPGSLQLWGPPAPGHHAQGSLGPCSSVPDEALHVCHPGPSDDPGLYFQRGAHDDCPVRSTVPPQLAEDFGAGGSPGGVDGSE